MDIRRITDLTHLAIADHVDPDLSLTPHNFINSVCDDLICGCLIVEGTLVPAEYDISHGLRTRQTANMGC
jgi:hypothetical protein